MMIMKMFVMSSNKLHLKNAEFYFTLPPPLNTAPGQGSALARLMLF